MKKLLPERSAPLLQAIEEIPGVCQNGKDGITRVCVELLKLVEVQLSGPPVPKIGNVVTQAYENSTTLLTRKTAIMLCGTSRDVTFPRRARTFAVSNAVESKERVLAQSLDEWIKANPDKLSKDDIALVRLMEAQDNR